MYVCVRVCVYLCIYEIRIRLHRIVVGTAVCQVPAALLNMDTCGALWGSVSIHPTPQLKTAQPFWSGVGVPQLHCHCFHAAKLCQILWQLQHPCGQRSLSTDSHASPKGRVGVEKDSSCRCAGILSQNGTHITCILSCTKTFSFCFATHAVHCGEVFPSIPPHSSKRRSLFGVVLECLSCIVIVSMQPNCAKFCGSCNTHVVKGLCRPTHMPPCLARSRGIYCK